jgi:hypothetical protein
MNWRDFPPELPDGYVAVAIILAAILLTLYILRVEPL